MFLSRNKKKKTYTYIKVGFKGSISYRHVFVIFSMRRVKNRLLMLTIMNTKHNFQEARKEEEIMNTVLYNKLHIYAQKVDLKRRNHS